MENKSEFRTLKRNTIVIAISSIGSKAISFILAPLYSYYLSPKQYGTMDLITTACFLILPILSLDIYEAVFRYANDDKYSEKTILSTALTMVIIENIVVTCVLIILSFLGNSSNYVTFTFLYVGIDSYYQAVSQFVRGRNKMIPFAVSGIINSVILLISNLILLVALRQGLYGWAISFLISKIGASIYISKVAQVKNEYSLSNVSSSFLKEAFAYCLPLLPNAIMWWAMNMSDRFLIALYLGVSANGIYAVASKVPSILNLFENVFFQSWQISAINTVNSSDRNIFISNVFEKYMIILTMGVLGVLAVLKPIISIFSREYAAAWLSSGILVISVMIHALGGFLGALYAAEKKTTYALYTSLVGAVTNIILNILFIPKFGLMAAASTTLIGYLVVLVIRWIHLSGMFIIRIKLVNFVICLVFIVLQLALYYNAKSFGFLLMPVIFVVSLIINKDIILSIIKK